MSKKQLIIIYTAVFTLFIVFAVVGYNYISTNRPLEEQQEPSADVLSEDDGEPEDAGSADEEQKDDGAVETKSTEDEKTEAELPVKTEEKPVLEEQPIKAEEKPQEAVQEQKEEPKQEKKNANPAPNFTVLNGSGNEISLSDKVGRPIVLNFWASWCPPCKNEFPHFQTAYNKYKDKVEFIMVDLVDGQRETVEIGKAFISQNNYTMPIYFDTKQSAARAYRISSIPVTYFIDKDGDIVNSYIGQLSEKNLFSAIDSMISSN